MSNLRYAKYSDVTGTQIDDPQQIYPNIPFKSDSGPTISLYQAPGLALLGDSINQQSTSVSAGSYAYRAQGAWIWALCYLGWPFNFEPSDNYAVLGTTIDAVINTQLPQILANAVDRNYKFCDCSIFTNDTNAGLDAAGLDNLKSKAIYLWKTLKATGIQPIFRGVKPRGTDGAITNAKKQNQELNDWAYQVSLTGLITYIPTAFIYADLSTSAGNALIALMNDPGGPNLHPNCLGARLEGKEIADRLVLLGFAPNINYACQQSDGFDSVYNRSGVMFSSANPLLQGTGGSKSGGATGSVPDGMQGNSGAWSKPTRTLVNGQNRTDALCALTASVTHYLYDDWVGAASGGWTAGQPQPGMYIEGRSKIVLDTLANVTEVSMRLAENNGSGNLTNYCLFHSESSAMSGNHTLYLKTPRIPIRPYSGAGQVTLFSRGDVVTTAAGSGNATYQQLEIRQIIVPQFRRS